MAHAQLLKALSGCSLAIGLSLSATLAPAVDDSSLAVRIAGSIAVDPSCPPPTVENGNRCVLQRDVTLAETLELVSNTTLNCQGHRLAPAGLGSGTLRSQPEVGILVVAGDSVRVQNCVLDGFDFGVFAVGSKMPPDIRDDPDALAARRSTFLSNVVNARFFGFQMFNVDNTEIMDNTITFTSPGGIGIEVSRDSDLNHLKNNTVIGRFVPPVAAAPLAPSNPFIFSGGGLGIFVAQLGALNAIPTLTNVIVGDTLYQIPVSIADRTEDNLIEGNTITQILDPSIAPIIALGTSQAIGTRILGNRVFGGSTGMTLNGAIGVSTRFPGTCSVDPGRLCLSDADCNLAGIDSTSKGFCVDVTLRPVTWPGEQYKVEDNQIHETSTAGINILIATDAVVSGNTVIGTTGRGIALGGAPALETATITRNVVAGVRDALVLNRTQSGSIASWFGAKIGLNDFTGFVNAVLTSNDYDVPTSLSVDDRGNYWGLTCREGGFDPARVKRQNGSVNPQVVDNHPYGEPVAQTRDKNLPPACY